MSWYDDVDWDEVAKEDAARQKEGYTSDDRAAIRRWNPENDSNFAMDTARDIARGAIGLVDAGVGLADSIYNAATGDSFRPEIRELGWTPEEWDREIALRNSFARQDADAAVQDAEGLDAVGAYLANPRALGGALAQQVPLLAGTVAGAAKAVRMAQAIPAISPKAAAIAGAAITEGALSGGSVGAAVGDHYAETGEDPGRKIGMAGLASGVGTGLIGAATGPIGGAVEAAVGSRIAGRGFVNALGKTPIRRGLRSAFGEGLEETLQSGQEQMWQNYGSGAPLSEDVATQMAVGGLLGGIMGGALHPFTGESARSQKNLMPGANATGEEQRTAQNTVETERKLAEIRRQYQMQQVQANRPMQAIPTDMSYSEPQVMPSAQGMATPYAQSGIMPAADPSSMRITNFPQQNQSHDPRPAQAIPTETSYGQASPNYTVQGPDGSRAQVSGAQANNLSLQDIERAPFAGMRVGQILDRIGYNNDDVDAVLANQKTVKAEGPDGKTTTRKVSLDDVFNTLTPAQQNYVIASLAARARTGQLDAKGFERTFNNTVNVARQQITEDSDQAVTRYVDKITNNLNNKIREDKASYYEALGELAGSTNDPRLAQMSLAQRIDTVMHTPVQNAAPQAQAVQTEAAPAEQTQTRQTAEGSTPRQEAISTAVTPVASQQTAVVPSQGRDILAQSEDATPTWAADNKTTRKREARQAAEDKAMDRISAIGRRRIERKKVEAATKSDKTLYSVKPKEPRKPKTNADLLTPVESRKYSDAESKAYRTNYGRKSTGTAVEDHFYINDGDQMYGNDAKRLVTNFMAGKMKITPKEVVERLYDRLTPESLETIRRSVEENATSQAGNDKPWVVWLHNALNEAVEQKRSGEELSLPNPPRDLMTGYREGQIVSQIGTPSLHMDAPTEVNVEFFQQPQFQNMKKSPTLGNLRKAGIVYGQGSSTLMTARDRYIRTVDGLKKGKLRLMVSEDADGSWGQIENGKAKAMLRVQQVPRSEKVRVKGWNVIVHENGDPATAEQQAEVFERLFWSEAAARNQKAKETGDDSWVPKSIDELVPREGVYDSSVSNDPDEGRPTSFMHETTSLSKLNDASAEVTNAYNTLANDADKRTTSLNKLGEDLKKLVPLVFKENMTAVNKDAEVASRIEKKHPFMKYLKDGDKKAFIHGFSDLAMFVPLNEDAKVTDAQLTEMFRQAGAAGDQITAPTLSASPTALAVATAWRKTAGAIGRAINNLPRDEASRKALASTVRDYVRKELVGPVEVPQVGTNERSRLANTYYARLAEIRPQIINAFARSLYAGMARVNHMPYRWEDRKGSKDSLGNGLISGQTTEAKDLREQFKDYIKDRFTDETGLGWNVRRTMPLEQRIAFYDRMTTDMDLAIEWIDPATAGKDFPKGRFRFTTDTETANQTVADFDPSDLWTGQWVMDSDLFSIDELKGSAKRATGKGNEFTTGSEKLFNLMAAANTNYAEKINYAQLYGQYQEAEKKVGDAKKLQETLTEEQERLEYAETALSDFLEEYGSPKRLREDWNTLLNEIHEFTRSRVIAEDIEAFKPELTTISEAMAPAFRELAERRNQEAMTRYEEMAAPLEEQTRKQFRRVSSVLTNMLKKDIHGDERTKLKERAQNLWLDYYDAYYSVNADVISAEHAQEMDAARDAAEARMADEQIRANRKNFQDSKDYIKEFMRDRGFREIADLLDNGTDEQIDAIFLARDTIDNLARMTSFLQSSGDLQNTHVALGELNRAIRYGNERGVLANDEQRKLYADALAAYLRGAYITFGDSLNERAQALHDQRVEALRRSSFNPQSNENVRLAYNEFQDLNRQMADMEPGSAGYQAAWDDAHAALKRYLDAREAAIQAEANLVAPAQVFGPGQHLSADLIAGLHKEATNVLGNNEDLQRFSDSDKGVIDKVLFSLGSTKQSVSLEKFSDDLKKALPTKNYREVMEDSATPGMQKRLLRAARDCMAALKGDRFADFMLKNVKVKFFTLPSNIEQDVYGVYSEIDGQKYLFLVDPRTRNPKSVLESLMHEISHHFMFVFDENGAHTLSSMDLNVANGKVEALGSATIEIAQLTKKYPELQDFLRYPLDNASQEPIFGNERMKQELLAQMGAKWTLDQNWRRIIKNEAPELAEILRQYLGDYNDGPTQPTGRSLDRLGEENIGSETSPAEEGRGENAEGAVLSARPQESERQSSGSGQSAQPRLERQNVNDTESRVAGEEQPQLRQSETGSNQTKEVWRAVPAGSRSVGSDVSASARENASDPQVEDQVARRANPPKSRIQRVISKLPPERRPLAQAVADTVSGWFGDWGVDKFLGMLFTTDLARMVKHVMPSIEKWISAKKERDAWINTRQQELGVFRHRFQELAKDAQTNLNKLWADTTLSGVWIEKPEWFTDKQWQRYMKNEHSEADAQALRQQFDALPPEAQRLYHDVLRYGHDSMVLKNQLMAEKANDYLRMLEETAHSPEELQDLKDSLKTTLQLAQDRIRNFTQPYVPLLRRGSHVVVARSQRLIDLQNQREELRLQRREGRGWTDESEAELAEVNKQILELEKSPKDYIVSFVDSQAQANRLATEIRKDFDGIVDPFPREQIGRSQAISLGTIHELENQLTKRLEDTDAEESRKLIRKMVNILNDMYTMSLSDYHANKNQLKRLKVAGFDENMMNNFLDNGYRETLFYGNVKFQGRIQDALRDMRNESNISGGDVSRNIRKRVLNEVMKREELDYSYTPNEAFEKAQRITSVMMLLTSPAFYLQNMTQSFMMTCPWLTHDFKGDRVFKDMADNVKKMIQAYFNKDYRSGIEIDFDKVPWMTAPLKAGLAIARSRGLIDIGISQDFGQLNSSSKFQEVTDYLSRGARVVEMVNRVASFTTAFNLMYEREMAKGNPNAQEAATQYACDAIYATHGDYSATNEPRYFKRGGMGLGGAEKLITQFRKFQLIQVGLVMRMAKDAFTNASPEARAAGRRAFAYLLGTHFTMTGLAGTPLVATLAFILNGIFGDDDDSAEDTMRKWIGDKGMSDLLIRGLPAYLGVDVSERIGAGNMFSPFPYLNATPLSGREGANETLVAMMGPFASQFIRMSQGAAYMSEGDMYKGIEMMLPNGLTNAMRAFRYATEGYTTKNGTVTIPPEEYGAMETFFQALGLPTTVTTDRYRLQEKLMNTQERRQREESRLNKAYRDAETAAERRAVMREYVKLQKKYEEMGFKPKPITQLAKNDEKVKKDAKNAVGGLVVNNSNRAFVQYWSTL